MMIRLTNLKFKNCLVNTMGVLYMNEHISTEPIGKFVPPRLQKTRTQTEIVYGKDISIWVWETVEQIKERITALQTNCDRKEPEDKEPDEEWCLKTQLEREGRFYLEQQKILEEEGRIYLEQIEANNKVKQVPKETEDIQPSVEMEEREFEIWSEGGIAGGVIGNPKYEGHETGCTFIEACNKWAERNGISPRLYRSDSNAAYLWGFRLWDNEKDAQVNTAERNNMACDTGPNNGGK